MDIIIDSLFYLIYFLKTVNLSFFVFALYLTEKLFSELYMKKVYALEENPPSLNKFILILLLVHAGFNVFIIVVLLMFMYMFQKTNNKFFINQYFLKNYVKDYIVTLFVQTLIALIIASIMQKKRYFRYKTEGLRAIRGFKEILMYISFIIFTLPYFYFLQ